MREAIRKHHISFKNAFSGLRWAFTSQPNFRVHFLLSFAALLLGWWLGLTAVEWTILVFTIFWGLAGEMINTSIEALTDLITREWYEEAKIAKDVAAGMMLTIAMGSIVVAGFLFIPKLLIRL